MENIPESVIDAVIKLMYNKLVQNPYEIEEQRRRDELKKGSIDVEFRVIE